MQDTSGALLQAASGSHPGLQPRSDRSDCDGDARRCHRRRRSRRMPALLPAGRVHSVCIAQGTCGLQARQPSRAGRQRPPGAESHVRAPGRAFTIRNMPDVAKTYCAHSRPIPIRDQCKLEVGWARVARAVSLAPTMSGDFSRSNARGRSDLHSPNDAWTSQAHGGPGMLPDRRGMSAASSPFRQNGVSRLAATCRSGIRQQIDGLGWPRETLCINTRDLRDNARVPWAG